jgi:hypothetical protein
MAEQFTDLYFAVYENGKSTYSPTWEQLSKSGNIVMYIKKIYHNYNTGMNNYPKAEYIILNSDGQPENYKIGSFEVVKIHKEPDLVKSDDKRVDILDYNTNELNNYTFEKGDSWWSVESFYIEFTLFMKNLHELGSWRAYEQSLELERKNREIERLKRHNDDLEKEIQALRNEKSE